MAQKYLHVEGNSAFRGCYVPVARDGITPKEAFEIMPLRSGAGWRMMFSGAVCGFIIASLVYLALIHYQ